MEPGIKEEVFGVFPGIARGVSSAHGWCLGGYVRTMQIPHSD